MRGRSGGPVVVASSVVDEELPNVETLNLANELLRERLEAQKSGIERIEAKALALLGFAALALQFLVTRVDGGGWMIAALIFYGFTLASGLAAIALYEHEYPPSPGRLVDAYLEVSRATSSTSWCASEHSRSPRTVVTPASSGPPGSSAPRRSSPQ